MMLGACSPKVQEVVKEETPVEEKPKKKVNPECIVLQDLDPSDNQETKVAYVLYRDLVKLEKYQEALPNWKKSFYAAPGGDGRIKYQYEDGIKIYKHLYDIAEEGDKQSIVDTIMSIYDQRVKCHPEDDAYVAGRKAFDYYYYYKPYIESDQLFDLFKKTIDAKGEKTDYFVVNPFTKMLYDGLANKTLDKEVGRMYAMKLWSILDYGNANCKGDGCEAWKIINGYAPSMLEQLEGLDDFYGCDYYADKYYAEYLTDPTDCEKIQTAYSRMSRGKCSQEDPRMKEVKAAYVKYCKKSEPKDQVGRGGYACYTAGDFKCAVEKFVAFAESTDDMEKKAKTYMLIAKVYYRDLKNFSKARKYARLAAKSKPNWGDPYMLIGKLYASSGPLCGPGTGFKSQVVTWVAIDKFSYAKRIDPAVSEEANKLIRNYSQYMPSKADIFQRRLKAGDTFKVGCWIQESTKIRTAD